METQGPERRAGAPDPDTNPPAPSSPDTPGPRAPAPRRAIRLLVPVLAVLGVLLLALLLVVFLAFDRLSSTWPFAGTETVDRTGPAVLLTITDLAEYRAATGRFQVVVDVERDVPVVPRQIAGERVLFVATGSVDAVVDFSDLGPDALTVSDDRTAVRIRLPEASLAAPTVDPEDSYVFERSRGLLDRLGSAFVDNPTSERELYLTAEEQLTAAAAESDLVAIAERNTRAMLTGLLTALGFTEVSVTYR